MKDQLINNTRITTVGFVNLSLSEIKEFELYTRPYQWITFKNVSLQPGHKTDVQVEGSSKTIEQRQLDAAK